MKFTDYIKLNITEPDNVHTVFNFCFDFLDSTKASKFNISKINNFKSTFLKPVKAIKYWTSSESVSLEPQVHQFLEVVSKNNKIHSNLDNVFTGCIIEYENMHLELSNSYSLILEVIDSKNPYSAFENLYIPDLSNKAEAHRLLKLALEEMLQENKMPERARRQIIKSIERAIELLEKKHTNWSMYFGILKETVIVLGAAGSLTGGVIAAVTVDKVKTTLDESIHVIESTSINNNYSNTIININSLVASNTNYLNSFNSLIVEEEINMHPALPAPQNNKKP